MITFRGVEIRKALNGCGYDYKNTSGIWCVYFTSKLSILESNSLDNLFK